MMTRSLTTGRQLIDYLDSEVRSGELNAGTASSRRSAVRQVLQVAFGDEWESKTFLKGDVASLLAKFAEAHEDDFTTESIRSYRSNFRRTVELSLGSDVTDAAGGERFTYRFPIREGVVVEMSLPVDLTVTEARRLSALITALPVDASRG